jgi:MbtH protein
MSSENEVGPNYVVVANHDEQYSIWPSGRAIPVGWRETSKSGTKAECLAFIIKSVWSNMRPASLHAQMGG